MSSSASPGAPVRVGMAGRPGRRERGVSALHYVEIHETFHQAVGAETLARWVAALPADKDVVLLAHRDLTFERREAPGAGLLRGSAAVGLAWDVTLEAVAAAGARGLILRTPAAFTPTDGHRRALRAAGARLATEAGTVTAFWEPRGLWDPDEIEEIAADAGFVPAWDPLLDGAPDGGDGPALFRLPGPGGVRGRYGEDDLLEVLERAQGRDRVHVTLDHPGGLADARRLARLLGEGAGPAGDPEDDADAGDDGDGEGEGDRDADGPGDR